MSNISPTDDTYRRLGPRILDSQAVGLRIDLYLGRSFPFLTRSAWQKRVTLGEVLVNGEPIRGSYRLRVGDELEFYHPQEAEPEVDRNIRILWHDGAVMAVFKPGNLPMHENGAYRKNTFATLLSELTDKEGLEGEWAAVHRLDRETSGIVLCGGTYDVRKRLADDFEGRRIKKEYLCIVSGTPNESQWSNCSPLGDLKTSQIRIKKWVVPDGLPAETGFICEAVAPSGYALLRAFPRTGRTNQIRIHAAHSGHWILGDKLYHPDEEVFLDYWKTGKTTDFAINSTGHSRCCLHAAVLEFTHPQTGRLIRIESPLPEDMQDLWLKLIDLDGS